jgi:ribonuclease HII
MASLKPYHFADKIEAGCDEAGRGCLAGPVFAAAVILPIDFEHPLLNDSKQMKPEDREEVKRFIKKKAIAWAVAQSSTEEIDTINILQASFLAMHRSLQQLKFRPEHILVDGNLFRKYENIQHTCIVEGDAIYASIAAASVLAKTYRDAYMRKLHREFPVYNWKKNKGYGTAFHREAIQNHGICMHHRKSFSLFGSMQQELFS